MGLSPYHQVEANKSQSSFQKDEGHIANSIPDVQTLLKVKQITDSITDILCTSDEDRTVILESFISGPFSRVKQELGIKQGVSAVY